jgi:hypothetical protein
MNALTYEMRSAAAAVAKPAQPATSVWTRIWDALIESRMRQAEREIRQHIHLIPADVLAEMNFRPTYKDAKKLPFVR